MVTVETRLISLLGYPLKQTFAPMLFNETFRRLGMDYFYFPVEVKEDKLGVVLNGLKHMNYAGFNVTKPNKIKILEYLDELDETAEKIGSVNVVTLKDGRLKGYNTDGAGFVQALLAETGVVLGETTFFVFGAGGAARAVCFTLAQEGAKKIFIVDKINEASTSLAGDINSRAGAGKCAVDVPFGDYPFVPYLEQSDVLINASGVGMYPYTGETPLEKKYLRKELLVCDLTYNPLKTRLLVEAEELGCKIMNGIGMVVNQAVKGFNLLTGRGEPYEIMKEAMDKILSSAKGG